MPRERQASSTELYWYYTGMIYGRSGLTTSLCLKGRFGIYDTVGGTKPINSVYFSLFWTNEDAGTKQQRKEYV